MDYKAVGDIAARYGRDGLARGRRVLAMVKEKSAPMIGAVLGFLVTPIGRWAAIAAMLAVAWASFAVHYEKKGASRVTRQIERKVSEHAQIAEDVRRSTASVPASGLRDAHTRD